MSGKSTLLRALGVNAVLAQAGGPVCAAALRLPPVELATSILIEDSLAAGVSFFMAEVLRIKAVVEAADRSAAAGRTLLYLLDEILRGTNSSERQVAVRRVLLHLLRSGAIGAVSSHDLALADAPALRDAARAVHFREQLDGDAEAPRMSFDYVLRPGPATSANALRLVEMMGLG
jgi:DNA mismatch repair ATPase MutS